MIDADRLYEAGTLPARCADCKWDNDGRLVIVDRYATDYPPIPRFNPDAFVELYRDRGGDPDDRISECDRCGSALDRASCEERTPQEGRIDA